MTIQQAEKGYEEEGRKFYDLASQNYLLANSMEKAAECLVKVAKLVEKKNINMTVGYMLRACKGGAWNVKNFDRQDFAIDTFNNTLNLLLRVGRCDTV